MSAPAELLLETRDGSVVAQLGGEVDMSNASYVRDQLLASMSNEAIALVLDISGCRYLDSAGIEVLFDVSRRLARRRQELRIVMPPSSPLRRVIELTEVHTAAPVYESLEGALSE
ncbi:MAG TPA: STAS domain-containing protein [Thermoleophilaceae bacterium]|nr:STAS domain-containing protein [Thermoleophilaceae bacterium]